MAIQGREPELLSMWLWIAAPKPACNDGLFEAGGKPGQMRQPRRLSLNGLTWLCRSAITPP